MKNIKDAKHINEFKRGDFIVRVECSKGGDRSYIGSKMQFLGVANGVVNLSSPSYGRITLPLDRWSNGWNNFKEIKDIKSNDNFIITFQNIVSDALNNEDYELLEELKNILNPKS